MGRNRNYINRAGCSRSGNAIMEMAIVLPVLLFMGLGMAEYGQYFYVKNAVQSAARDVARFSIPAAAVQTDPANAATSTLAQYNITFNPSWMSIVDDAYGQVVTDVSQVPAGDAITVYLVVNYTQLPNTYRPLFLMTGKGIGNGKVILGQCTAIKE